MRVNKNITIALTICSILTWVVWFIALFASPLMYLNFDFMFIQSWYFASDFMFIYVTIGIVATVLSLVTYSLVVVNLQSSTKWKISLIIGVIGFLLVVLSFYNQLMFTMGVATWTQPDPPPAAIPGIYHHYEAIIAGATMYLGLGIFSILTISIGMQLTARKELSQVQKGITFLNVIVGFLGLLSYFIVVSLGEELWTSLLVFYQFLIIPFILWMIISIMQIRNTSSA
ncbi:MAG: hypothetical protein ACW98Y_11945 [Candidatus Thorarchaeota archaeon]